MAVGARTFFTATPLLGADVDAALRLLAATLGARLTLLSPMEDTLEAMLIRRETVRVGAGGSAEANAKSAIV